MNFECLHYGKIRTSFKRWIEEWGILTAFIVIKLLVHFLIGDSYELHRDSFLYIAQSRHPAWGYVSTPPFISIITSLSCFLFGDTPFGYRFFPAVTGAISILLIGIMIKELGGKRLALITGCLAYLISPAFLRSNTLLQPVSFDQFFWLLTFFLIFRLIRTPKPVYWIWIGIVAGIGILNKHSMPIFLAGVFLALLVTPNRRWLATRYPYIAALIALAIITPHLIWQYQHDWPLVRHMKELQETHLVNVRLDIFILEQFLMNIPAVLVWMAGLAFLVFHREGEKYEIISFTFLFTLAIMIILRGKHYYTLGLYPVLFAFGGFALEKVCTRRLRFINYFILGFMLVSGLTILPISLPILEPDRYIHYMSTIGMEKSQRWEDGQYYDLPQDYADMIGWKELTYIVARTWNSLSPGQQAACTILSNNYGEAGAIDYYGKKLKLPAVISFQDNYLLWAPDSVRADYLIRIGDDDNLSNLYDSIVMVGEITTPHARQEGTPVHLCFKPRLDIDSLYRAELATLRSNRD